METEMISKLLEKLDKQQYTDVIRSFSQHNKRLKIPEGSAILAHIVADTANPALKSAGHADR